MIFYRSSEEKRPSRGIYTDVVFHSAAGCYIIRVIGFTIDLGLID